MGMEGWTGNAIAGGGSLLKPPSCLPANQQLEELEVAPAAGAAALILKNMYRAV
jgi:hypothetical protein